MAVMSDLPPELLDMIARKLTEPPDLIRFRSVSSRWHSATSSLPLPPPRLPWFFVCFIPDELLYYFYSLSEDRIYKIHSPNGYASVDLFNLSITGWFRASNKKTNDGNFTPLMNLFTGTAVDLPFPNVTLNVKKNFPDYNNCVWKYNDWLLAGHYFLSVAKSKTYPDNCLIISSLTRYVPMVRFDAWMQKSLHPMFDHLKDEHLCYLTVSYDKLYILVNIRCKSGFMFMVYEMSPLAKKQEWIHVSDIGDRAILYDQKSCFLVEEGCSTGLERNSVYFPELKSCKREVDHHVDWIYCMSRFDLSNGTSEEVSCQLGSFFISDPRWQSFKTHSWIVPTFVEKTD